MKKNTLLIVFATVVVLSACGDNPKKGTPEKMRTQLKKYKTEMKELKTKISNLEKQLTEADPEFARQNRKTTLVTTLPVETRTFRHFLELQGSIASDENISVSAETAGKVERVYVDKGEKVNKGQVLVRLDSRILKKNIEEVETSLNLAKTVYERQKNLWDKNIGTEIQYLEAKNNKESLENRLSTLKTQLSDYQVKAPFTGNVDKLMIREGEMAQPGMPMITMVGTSNMYVEVDVPEAYIGDFSKGDQVELTFPSRSTTVQSTIKSIGEVINPQNRTFTIELNIPDNSVKAKPNMMAVVKLKDFEAEDAVVIPSNLIQQDNKGDFVYVLEEKDGVNTAAKKRIERGITYQSQTHILSGLSGNELLIDEGFREVAEGVNVQIVEQNT
jgi:membrane fusion protein, multidrug efflux system